MDRPDYYSTEAAYSKIWEHLRNSYGQPINTDGIGACFRGPKGETAVLVDNSQDKDYDEIVLIKMPIEVASTLEKIIQEAQEK
jgi:hypothetical protein